MKRKVVVTAVNALTALGLDMETTWKSLLAGKPGVKRISLFNPEGLETQIAAQLPDEFAEFASLHIKKRIARQMTRVTQMAFACTKQGIEKHHIDTDFYEKDKCAVIMGIVNTGNSSVENNDDIKNMILKGMSNSISAWISLEYGFEGPNFAISTACASSAYAIAMGFDMIESGKADLVICGGADSIINREEIEGFNAIFALSTANENPEKASCPFSANRDGFVIGEGAGMLVLESEEMAKQRGAVILAEISGYALTSEAYNIVSPKEEGEGMYITMKKALEHAGIQPEQIHHINAHGTSTTLNDLYETKAIKKLFGQGAYNIPVVSSKSMIGHTIGAAGVIEGVIAIKSLAEQKLHPTINLEKADPELDLDYVPESRSHQMEYVISNSFGFGGHNASLVFKTYTP